MADGTGLRVPGRRRAGLALSLLGLLALASGGAPASALGGFFAGRPVDGPAPEVVAVGDVDLGRDGGGGVAYVRRDDGESHAFLSLLREGLPQPGARVDAGHGPIVGRPALAVGEGGRLAVLWADAQGVWARVRPTGSGPLGAPQRLGGPGAAGPVADMTVSGVAYAAWSENGDVRAAYLPRLAQAFTAYPAPLDADPARLAGTGAGASLRPRLATAADGVGLAVWGELDGSGVSRIRVRRLVKERLSAVTADATPAGLDGRNVGFADLPDVALEDDSSFAWVVFRQAMADGSGRVRAVVRRLRGSAFDEAATFDGAPSAGAVETPRVAANGRGWGIATVEVPGGTVLAVPIREEGPAAPQAIGPGAGVVPSPVAAYAQSYDGVVAWLQASGPGTPAVLRARALEDAVAATAAPTFGAAVTLSDPAGGGVDSQAGHDAGSSRAGDVLIAYVEGAPGARRLSVAAYDQPPRAPDPRATRGWRRTPRPALGWASPPDVWGGLVYRVLVDRRPVGDTGRETLRPAAPLADGTHRWQVVAIDRRGQQAASEVQTLRVDTTRPTLGLRVLGTRRVGARLRLAVRAGDGRGSGVREARLSLGDRSASRVVAPGRVVQHAYRRAGRYRLVVTAHDRAGNAATLTRTIVVRGS
ncbi:MAG: hypothetical protein LT070_03230 [Solirubrobacteraceae bacterium]|nr:hypothetical protein [Solirubrobacteraceae bacterium]